MDLNRVEGDMEVRLELDGHSVTDAWCVGTMFRGFEQISWDAIPPTRW